MISNPNDIEIEIDDFVFNDVYLEHLDNETRTQIFYGGAGSGKSVFLAQRAVYDILQGGRNYLVCRAVGKYIRKSVFNEVEQVIKNWGVEHLFITRKQEMTITCIANDYQIMFTGLDDADKLKSIKPKQGVITDIWIEEATETAEKDLKQLNKRLRGVDTEYIIESIEGVKSVGGGETKKKRITLSFNPIVKSHWIYKLFFNNIEWTDDQTEYQDENLFIMKTWYIHNAFMTTQDVVDLEDETDKYFYEVYTLGNWGVLGNVIFTNWQVQDLSEMTDQFTNHRNGLDFGFSSHPAAIVKMHYDKMHQTIYIYGEFYETGLTNDLLAKEAIDLIGDEYVICDSAEPKSIVELQNHGVRALGAKKGPDSVMYGIQWLQQQTIIIDVKCINTKNEFQTFHWKEDKDGVPMRRPFEKDDHAIAGIRYAMEEDMHSSTASIGTGAADIDNYMMRQNKKDKRPRF